MGWRLRFLKGRECSAVERRIVSVDEDGILEGGLGWGNLYLGLLICSSGYGWIGGRDSGCVRTWRFEPPLIAEASSNDEGTEYTVLVSSRFS